MAFNVEGLKLLGIGIIEDNKLAIIIHVIEITRIYIAQLKLCDFDIEFFLDYDLIWLVKPEWALNRGIFTLCISSYCVDWLSLFILFNTLDPDFIVVTVNEHRALFVNLSFAPTLFKVFTLGGFDILNQDLRHDHLFSELIFDFLLFLLKNLYFLLIVDLFVVLQIIFILNLLFWNNLGGLLKILFFLGNGI